MISLAIAATASTTATLGTCVLQLPMRSPTAVARQAGSLQVLTGGRFVLGVGVGSHPGEYEAAGADYGRRGRLLDEGIEAIRHAWASGGNDDLRYRQDPVASPIPIWVAGASDAAVRRAAHSGDGWVPLFVSPTEYGAARRKLLDLADEAGRDAAAIDTSVVVVLSSGHSTELARSEGSLWLSDLYRLAPKAFDRHVIAGSPDDCAAGISAYHDAGARHVVVMVAADQTLEHFGPVIEALRSGSSAPMADPSASPTSPARLERLGVAP